MDIGVFGSHGRSGAAQLRSVAAYHNGPDEPRCSSFGTATISEPAK